MSWSANTNPNSIQGSYGGNSIGSMTGGSHGTPFSITNGQTTITPSVSHSTFQGHHNTVGAGVGVQHQMTPSTSVGAHVHQHGNSTSGGFGFKWTF